jgi:ethanolamine utilization protein EutJ
MADDHAAGPPGWEMHLPTDSPAEGQGGLDPETDRPPGPVPQEERGEWLARLLAADRRPVPTPPGTPIRVGLDLGTASIVLVVLAADGSPLGLAREDARVVRDGLVVDFGGARAVVKRLKARLEAAMGAGLDRAAIAVPPGTGERDAATHRFVAEGAGLEVDAVLDEPVAANLFLGLTDGAIADLGGGTTGVAVIKDGRLIESFDEATGGHHLSLRLAGHFGIPLERAEAVKLDPKRRGEVAPLVAPVLAKMGRIIARGLAGLDVPSLTLAGGSAAAPGAGAVIAQETGLPTMVCGEPELITPAGIALGCRAYPAGKSDGDA